jgi:hypothetical protein
LRRWRAGHSGHMQPLVYAWHPPRLEVLAYRPWHAQYRAAARIRPA